MIASQEPKQIPDKQHSLLLKQYKGTDRRHRLKVLDLHRLYRSYTPTSTGIARFLKLLSDATKEKQGVMILKYLILIHGIVQFNSYPQSLLECLLEFSLSRTIESCDTMQEWLVEVVQGYFKYLSKISFHGDIYLRSITSTFSPSECVVDLFMTLNQLNAYVHQAKSVFNCAGRYYHQKLFEMEDFFDILQGEFSSLYILLREIIHQILRNYKSYSSEELESFVESFQELDKINDSLEELLRNKHYQKPLRFEFVELNQEDEFNILNLIYARENTVLES